MLWHTALFAYFKGLRQRHVQKDSSTSSLLCVWLQTRRTSNWRGGGLIQFGCQPYFRPTPVLRAKDTDGTCSRRKRDAPAETYADEVQTCRLILPSHHIHNTLVFHLELIRFIRAAEGGGAYLPTPPPTPQNDIFWYQSVARNSRMLYFHWLLD